MVVFFNQDFLFFILFFFLSFHFHPCFISFFLFSFACFSPPHKTHSPLLFIFFFTSRSFQHFTSEKGERERERDRLGPPPSLVVLPTNRLGSDQLFFFFLFNFILRIGFCFVFCVWINYFAHEQVSLFSLFSFFFFFYFSDFIGL